MTCGHFAGGVGGTVSAQNTNRAFNWISRAPAVLVMRPKFADSMFESGLL
jgi:hypothetical protein